MSVQVEEYDDTKAIYRVSTSWLEIYVNASTNSTDEIFACKRKMRAFDQSSKETIVSENVQYIESNE